MGRPRQADKPKVVVHLTGTSEFREWSADLAKHCRASLASVVENALVEYARGRGFDQAAPERN